MDDPYRVLGLTPDATADEVKAAYKKLAKKYHPDLNGGSAYAEAKMKELNEAYDIIVKGGGSAPTGHPQGGPGAGGYGPWSYGAGNYGAGGGYRQYGWEGQGEDPAMAAARNFINSGRYAEAFQSLNQSRERSARWYFYRAVANAGLGNQLGAFGDARQAVQMDPGNPEYRSLFEQLRYGSQTYQQYQGHGMPKVSAGNIFMGLCVARLLCMFCGRGC